MLDAQADSGPGIGGNPVNDGALEVFWDGGSYGIWRTGDKVPVARGFSSRGWRSRASSGWSFRSTP
jgi:hypothetical protein